MQRLILNCNKNEKDHKNSMDGIGDADVVGKLHQKEQRKANSLL